MVLDVRVRNVDGVGSEDSNGVDLEQGRHFRYLEISVERVTHHGVARVGVRARLDGGFGSYHAHIAQNKEGDNQEPIQHALLSHFGV